VKEAQDKLRADLKLEYDGCNRVGAARNSNAAKVPKPGPAGGQSKDPLANKLVFEDTNVGICRSNHDRSHCIASSWQIGY